MSRTCDPGDCPYCHRYVVDVYSHLLHTPCQAARQATSEAVATERARIRQLADEHHATAAVDCACADPGVHEPGAGHYVRFSDLLDTANIPNRQGEQ